MEKNTKLLSQIRWLLVGNFAIMALVGLGLLAGIRPLLKKSGEAVGQVTAIAKKAEPLVDSLAGKGIQAVKGLNARRLTNQGHDVIDSAVDKAKRFFGKDKKK